MAMNNTENSEVKVKALVLSGDGINCETETISSFKLAGAYAEKVHVNRLLETPEILNDYQILCLPGGFSFGDDLGSGRVLALKLKHGLKDQLNQFVSSGGLILGICNGFQVLVKLGILNSSGHSEFKQDLTLTVNQPRGFINKWVNLKVNPESPCIWTKGIDEFELPIRHGEGRLILSESSEVSKDEFRSSGNIALFYDEDVNGSFESAAGVCDSTGRIFGLMPHPEAFQVKELGRDWTRLEHDSILGQKIFDNGVKAALEKI
jgi:phosphoribosylformylglycinamidine synthase